MTDTEIQIVFPLPLCRPLDPKKTAHVLYGRLHTIWDQKERVKYGNPELEHLIQMHHGCTDNIDDFDIDQLK